MKSDNIYILALLLIISLVQVTSLKFSSTSSTSELKIKLKKEIEEKQKLLHNIFSSGMKLPISTTNQDRSININYDNNGKQPNIRIDDFQNQVKDNNISKILDNSSYLKETNSVDNNTDLTEIKTLIRNLSDIESYNFQSLSKLKHSIDDIKEELNEIKSLFKEKNLNTEKLHVEGSSNYNIKNGKISNLRYTKEDTINNNNGIKTNFDGEDNSENLDKKSKMKITLNKHDNAIDP